MKKSAFLSLCSLLFLGKTEEAQADMARLAMIRKNREEAAKKREEERRGMHSKSVMFRINSLVIVEILLFPAKDDVKKAAEQRLLDKKKQSGK